MDTILSDWMHMYKKIEYKLNKEEIGLEDLEGLIERLKNPEYENRIDSIFNEYIKEENKDRIILKEDESYMIYEDGDMVVL